MTPRIPIVTAALAAALLAGCGQQAQPPGGERDGLLRYGELAFEPCSLSAPGAEAVEAQCTTLAVPEDHDRPEGRSIELAIAWLPARGLAEDDPIYMISGGPGQSALETYPTLDRAFADARRSRHVVLVDARGTGGSHPLKCTDDAGKSAFGDA